MITLTINGAGNASNSITKGDTDAIKLVGGERYGLLWSDVPGFESNTGTLALKINPAGMGTHVVPLRNSERVAITYNLATETDGMLEFLAPCDGYFQASISGGVEAKAVSLVITKATE